MRLYTQLHQGMLLTSHLIIHPLTFHCPTPCLLPFLFSLLPSPQPPFLSIKHLTFQKCSDDPFLLSWHLTKSFTTFSLPHCHTHTITHIHTYTHSYTHTYNSYIPQTEQDEPEERMLFRKGNVTDLLDVTHSNPYHTH